MVGTKMTNNTTLRTAVVGMGKLGLLHAATFNALADCRLTAIVDKSDQMLRAIGSKMSDVAVYKDHRRMLEDVAPDIVAIATPTAFHCAIAADCVERGAHIFIEKPLCLVPDDAAPLVAALARHKRVNMVGYMTRFMETFRKAKEIADLGVLGRMQMLRTSMYIGQLFARGKGWRYDPQVAGGGVLMTQNSHLVDMLLWMFGPVATVSAHTSRLYSEAVEDHAHVFFEFASGMRGFLDASWSARHYRTPTMQIHAQGENGTLDVNDDRVALFLLAAAGGFDAGWHEWRKPDLYRGVPFDIGGANYTAQAMQFISSIRGSANVESDVQSALKVQQVISAAYRSAERGGAPTSVT
jgi:predicted dehydrogenase